MTPLEQDGTSLLTFVHCLRSTGFLCLLMHGMGKNPAIRGRSNAKELSMANANPQDQPKQPKQPDDPDSANNSLKNPRSGQPDQAQPYNPNKKPGEADQPKR